MEDFEKKRRNIAIVLAILAGVIIVIMGASILGKGNKSNNGGSVVINENTNNTNYTTTTDGNKVNTSTEVASDKKVGNILISKSSIVYKDGSSLLTSKVTNDNISKDNLRFKIKFIANDGSTIAEAIGYVGIIKENETKFIDSYITTDVSNAKNITYEILE